jgi:DNA-binding MarR family transcriptional regulator
MFTIWEFVIARLRAYTPFMEQTAKSGVKDCNCWVLRQAARRISNFYDSELAPTGLRATQFAILALVSDMGEASVNSVAERLLLDRTTAGKNLRPLEKAGLISIGAAKNDARQRAISLTRTGLATLKQAVPLWRKAQSRFETANGSVKAAQLRAMLRELKVEA